MPNGANDILLLTGRTIERPVILPALSAEQLLEVLKNGTLGGGVAAEVLAFAKLFYCFPLCAIEFFRHVNADLHYQVAHTVTVALYGRKSFSAEAEGFARLRARLNLYLHVVAVKSRNVYLPTKDSCREIEQEIVNDVLAVSDKGFVLFLFYIYLYVSRYSIMLTGISLARNVYDHSFCDACRDVYFYDFLALDNTVAVAVGAFVLDDCSLSPADVAGCLCLHHAEDTLLGANLHTAAMTIRTGLCTTATLGTRSVAVGAGNVLADLELLGNSCSYFLKRQTHFQAQIRATVFWGLAMSACSAKATKASTSAEDIAEHGEYVVHREASASERAASAESATRRVESELVILLSLLWVVENVVSLSGFLKLLFRLWVVGISVGVIFDGKFAVCLLYLVFRGTFAHAEYLVVISFCHLFYVAWE